MDSSTGLDDAILLAAQAHHGKKDKLNRPYVLHVLRVMLMLESDEERIVGVLHDVVEESGVTLDRLRELGYSERVVKAIDLLTWRKNQESYEGYIGRLKVDPLAVSVKRADLADHLEPSVEGGPDWLEKNHPNLYKRYKNALLEIGVWEVLGKDAFDIEAEMYPLGEYRSKREALKAAYRRLKDLEETQPTSDSDRQSPDGIQDRIYIKTPEGKIYRITPPSQQ
ncbi:hypothetical protein E2P64_04945 [Candidatus Bathyarchaeota archaeon]|nr:hypothetical protein E2P64_04945 [Candidatus Bathyarchaeota archaeon]